MRVAMEQVSGDFAVGDRVRIRGGKAIGVVRKVHVWGSPVLVVWDSSSRPLWVHEVHLAHRDTP